MKGTPSSTEVLDLLGVAGIVAALYLGIPALALHLAWAGGDLAFAGLMAVLLIGTACSAWRDLSRGHVGKLSASLATASVVGLAYLVWPVL